MRHHEIQPPARQRGSNLVHGLIRSDVLGVQACRLQRNSLDEIDGFPNDRLSSGGTLANALWEANRAHYYSNICRDVRFARR